jgi:hypothetical protein
MSQLDYGQMRRDARASILHSLQWDVDWQRKYVIEQVEELRRREMRLALEETPEQP